MGSEFYFFKIIPNFYGVPFDNMLLFLQNSEMKMFVFFIDHKMLKFQPCGWHIKRKDI